MKLNQLRTSIPGLIPLVILIVAEWIWGMTTGLWLAVAYGLGELAYYAIRYKRFEKNALADTGLMVVLGVLAITLEGPVLERISPLIYLFIMILMVGVSAFSKHNVLMASSGRLLKNKTFGPWEMEQMRLTMLSFFWWMSAYFLFMVVAVFWLPIDYQSFINGTGLYFYIGFAFLFELVRKRLQNKKWAAEEWVPLVEADGKMVGAAPRSVVHNGKTRWLHPVVHLQVIKDGGLWLQKRPLHKLVQPGKWDTAVGGHMTVNESVELSLQRETAEEIGVKIDNVKLLGRYNWECPLENEMVFAFVMRYDGPVMPNPEELDGGRVWSFSEIDDALNQGVFTPNFEYEYGLYRSILTSQ